LQAKWTKATASRIVTQNLYVHPWRSVDDVLTTHEISGLCLDEVACSVNGVTYFFIKL